MKQTIEIEIPEGYKAKYNPDTKSVKIIKDEFNYTQIKSFENAFERMNPDNKELLRITLEYLQGQDLQLYYLLKLRIIIAVCHGYDSIGKWMSSFEMTSGKSYYPYTVYKQENNSILWSDDHHFYPCAIGLGYFNAIDGVSNGNLQRTLLPCKTEEIAKYVAKQFPCELFYTNFIYTGEKYNRK